MLFICLHISSRKQYCKTIFRLYSVEEGGEQMIVCSISSFLCNKQRCKTDHGQDNWTVVKYCLSTAQSNFLRDQESDPCE